MREVDLADLYMLADYWREWPPEHELLAAQAGWSPTETVAQAGPFRPSTREELATMGLPVRAPPPTQNVPGLPGWTPPADLE